MLANISEVHRIVILPLLTALLSIDPVGEIIGHMTTKRGKAAVIEKILSLGLVDDRKQLYKKRGGKSRRKSRRGHDSGDEGLCLDFFKCDMQF